MDADIGHKHLDLKMTDRVNMRMVGVPESFFSHWASKLLQLGYKVAKVSNWIRKLIRATCNSLM